MAKKEDELNENEKLLAEAKALGVTQPKVRMAGFTIRGKTPEPTIIEAEEKKHKKLADEKLKIRVHEAKQRAKQKPIDKRRDLIKSRFKAVKNRTRANTYSDKNIQAWLEELNLIENNPKSWIRLTKNGTIPFVPGNRKKKTAREILDSMDLE